MKKTHFYWYTTATTTAALVRLLLTAFNLHLDALLQLLEAALEVEAVANVGRRLGSLILQCKNFIYLVVYVCVGHMEKGRRNK